MRASELLIPTLRETPANAEVASHQLLLRAGFIRQLGSGLFTWLALGVRVLRKIEAIVREELTARDAQEVLMPVVQPAEFWQESGRWYEMGDDLLRMVDRHERDYCFSPTHEEVMTDLFRNNISSYRQLPCNLFQFTTKFRDEIRPRFGVLRAREFIMKDGYSFHIDEESFEITYRKMHDAYTAILDRIGLDFRAVDADAGLIGDGESHEFHVLAQSGEDELAFSPASDFAANVEKAEAITTEERQPPSKVLTKVATPDVNTIDEVAAHLSVSPANTVKTLIVKGEDELVALVVRGDHELNEFKAAHLDGVLKPLQMGTQEEIHDAVGCLPGSIGPIGLKLTTYVDRAAAQLNDFVCGANDNGFHFVGANWIRDTAVENIVDIRKVVEGDPAPDGSGPLAIRRGIEVGHIFKLGTKYSTSMNATVLDPDGKEVAPMMGCYGFGVTRLVAAIVEQQHDDAGILWPDAVAPFDVHILALGMDRSESVASAANDLYADLQSDGLEVLLDDRDVRPGVKFGDADLIGIPNRVTIGERGLKRGVVEYAYQRGETLELKPAEIATAINNSRS